MTKKEPTKRKGYCDVCGAHAYIFPVILKDESGTGEYCETCVLNNPRIGLYFLNISQMLFCLL